jgi:DNA-binding beta-propeller fold protein YncE
LSPGGTALTLTATSITSGTIIVADTDAFGGAGGLIAVDPTTGTQTTVSQGGLFADPAGVAIAADGTIYVTDLSAFGNIIAVNPSDGVQHKVAASTVFFRPMGVVLDPQQQLVVAYLQRANGLGTVMRVNPANGEFHAIAPTVLFGEPAAVALDGLGHVFATDVEGAGGSCVHRIDADGSDRILLTNSPPGALYTGIAVEPDGHILLVNQPEHGDRQILEVDGLAGGPGTVLSTGNKLHNPFGIAVQLHRALFLADTDSGVVRVDPATGAQSVVSAGGSFVQPIALAIA